MPVEKRSHNHPPDPARTQVLVAVDKMTDTAATSNAPPRRIISATTINLTADAQSIVPKRKALRAKIQRKRRRIEIGQNLHHLNFQSLTDSNLSYMQVTKCDFYSMTILNRLMSLRGQ